MQGLTARLRRHPLVSAIFVLALILTLFFAVRLTVRTLAWSDPALHDQPIEAWMTPGYVGHSWHLPRDVVVTALRLDPEGRSRMTLQDIARDQGIPVADVIAQLEAAIADYRGGAGD